ncbi:putative membrane protein [Bifidobacterium reuteri DSM 23975]|uniref:Putative membrane protein n=1 Tax=Bifidobacterium reuteri DSM 23975 TaxID=1437610 RepID=A0A087CMC1_9BIFI|nr:hypothetical protein [Bifidobacterium reuteri]KFI84421.1 putative membrane protein [Bifidobacterium reuteri DSM 23975]
MEKSGTESLSAQLALTERQRNIIIVFLLTVVIVIGNIPFLSRTPLWAADLDFHLFRIKGIAEGLQAGQFPVRMQTVQVSGYGYPTSIMYPDIFLYVPAILNCLGFSVYTSYHLFAIAVNITSILISYACFRRIFHQSRAIGVTCAALWSLNTYRLDDIYSRGSLGEWLAMLFFPVLIYGLYLIFANNTNAGIRGGILCAVATTGIINSHVLSTAMTALVAIPALIVLLIFNHSISVWKQLGVALLITILLSAFFIIPFADFTLNADMTVNALSDQQKMDLASRKAIEPGQLLLLFSPLVQVEEGKAFAGDIPYSLGWATIAFALLWPLMLILRENRDSEQKRLFHWGIPPLITFGLAAFLTTTLFPWNASRLHALIGTIATVQFPTRFVSYAAISLILMGGLGCFLLIRSTQFSIYAKPVIVLILAMGLMEGAVTCSTYLQNAKPLDPFEQVTMATNNGVMAGEYLPANTDLSAIGWQTNPYADSKRVTVKNYNKRGNNITVTASSEKGGIITLPLFAYPHYQIQENGKHHSNLSLSSSKGNTNLLTVSIPQGWSGTFTVSFVEPASWKIATALSAVTFLIIIIAYTATQRYRNLTKKHWI